VSHQEERLDLRALGAEVVLRPSGPAPAAGDLTFDVIGRPRGFVTQPHIHSGQIERFEMIAGAMRIDVARRGHVLGPGDRFEIPAGASHRQRPAGDGAGHVRVTVSPAGRTEEFLRRVAEMSSAGRFTRGGLPRPLAAAELFRDFGDTGRATFPPEGAQKLLARVLLADPQLGRRIGRALERLWRAYEFVDEWEVAAPPQEVYEVLVDGRSYPRWWRPVYLDVTSEGPPAVGAVSCQHFKGRLPYHLRTRSTLVALEPPALIVADVDGDLRGRGIWTLTPTTSGTHVRFDWTVHADRPLLRALTPALRPLLRANHHWAIARAIDGLEPYVRSRAAADGEPAHAAR
jgi:uncharacterized protein YndB with AHSA1/START domain/quercetin dioxygenase-like cupin family protein